MCQRENLDSMRRCLEGRPKERSRSPPSTWREGVIVQSSGTRTSESRSAREPELHILYASPLDHRIPQINIQGEVDLLQDSLKEANCRMKISVGAATTKSFAQLLTLAETAGSIILHLSVHVVNAESNVGVVFENDFGGAHILYRPQLEELLGNGEQLHGLSFVFINGCSSESIAEILVEAGCHLVIATRGKVYDSAATVFTQQFYYALGSQVSVRSAFERAQQVLRVDPNPQVKASADMFVLFGQHAARSQTLPRRPTQVHESADGQSGLRSELWDLGAPGCLPPRVEDYIDRSSVLREVLRNLEWSSGKQARRACILYGPEGIGKSVAAIELAYFASSPGRLFSRKVLFVTIEGKPDLANVLQGISLALARRRLLTSASRNQKDVLQALQQMDKTRSRYLLVLDDHSGAVHGSPQVRSLLSNIMETVRNLSLVVCSREHVYESLGPCKCVNVPLGPLTDAQSAELFLKRSHRPLHPSDLEPGARSQQNLTQNEEFLKNLAGHPLLRRMGGNPGQVNAMCQRVTPELKSLWDLCTWLPSMWLPGMATTTTRVRSMSFESENLQSGLRRMSEMPDSSMQLTRKMSIDGVHTEPMVRMMSMDGPPLARMMSVDETQATENGIDHS